MLMYILMGVTGSLWLFMLGVLCASMYLHDLFLFKAFATYWLLHIGVFFIVWSHDFKNHKIIVMEE